MGADYLNFLHRSLEEPARAIGIDDKFVATPFAFCTERWRMVGERIS